MPSLGGITEIIGVRAVIIDVRQYLADGREIERTNDRIAASTKKVEATSLSSAKAQDAARAAINRANSDANAVIAAKQKLLKLEQDLAAAQKIANAPTSGLVGGNNQPLANTGAAAAAADVKRLTGEVKVAQAEFNTLKGTAVTSFRAEAAAASGATIAQERHNVALEQEARLQEQLSAARRSRINAATTGVALVGTAAIALTAGASIQAAAKYQQELSKINVLTNATDEETRQLGESFKTLSTQIPVSASDLAATAYKLLSSGIKDTGQALEITTGAAKAAVAGQADIKDIVSATIAVLNGYPKGAITASQANDILFAGVKEGAAEFNDFAGSIGKLIPIAAALNVPFDQLTASLAVLTNGGLNAEEAATGLRAILNDLAKDENSKQAQEALAQFGLTVSDVRHKIRDEGLPQAMGELITLFNGNLAAIEPIIPNIRGMVAAFSAFNNNGKTTIGVLNSIDNAGGIVDQSFAKTKDNVANLAQIVQNQLNVALIEIGQAVLPAITVQLQSLIQWINANKEAITKFVSEGLELLVQTISYAAQGFEILRGAMAQIVGQADATKAALVGIGLALAWALPGGPIIKGILLISTLLGALSAEGGPGDKTAQKLNDFLGLGSKGKPLSPEQVRSNIGSGTIESGVRNTFKDVDKNFREDLIQSTLKNLKEQGVDTSKGVDELDRALNKTKDTVDPLSKVTLPQLNNNVDAVDQSFKKSQEEALKAAQALQKVAQEFQKSSEAARQVDSLTASLKLFGEITPEIAKNFNLSAVQAGNVQGVDAVAAATERATNRSFEYTKALATVAEALQIGGTSAVRAVSEIINGIAQAALSASQSALNELLSQPTREQANLGVGLAFQNQQTTNLQFRNQPQITALEHQLKDIDRQIAAQNRANQAAQRQREQQQKAQQAAQKAQEKAQQAEADARKIANLQAQQAAERQLAALQKLIDANNKNASDLQEAFIKNNNDLQQQINTAIGKGDSATALSLVDQQRAATKQYRDQSKALQKSNQDLAAQQKAQQEAEAERQRQVQLADALFEAQQHQKSATDDNTDSTSDNTDAQDAQTQALEDQKQKIQDQIDALQAPIDKSKEQADSIQRAIDLYKSQADVLKAQGVAADKTLKTQDQQREAAKKLIEQIGIESGAVKKFSDQLGLDTSKAINDANDQFRTLTGLLKVLNDPSGFLAKGFDPNAKLAEIIKTALEDPAAKQTVAANNLKDAADKLKDAISKANQQHAGQNEAFQFQQFNPVNGPVISDDVLRRAGLLRDTLNSIKPPNVGDAGLASIQTSTTAAQTLGTTLALQINPPDIGDAGKQTIDNSTFAAQSLGFTLATQVKEPDIGDSGRQTILDATDAARGLGTVLGNIATQIQGLGTKLGQLVAQANNIKPPKIPGFAQGGFFTKPTLGIVGEAGPEVVLPLDDVKRMAQVLQLASTGSSNVATSASLSSSDMFNALISSTGGGLLATTGPGKSTATGQLGRSAGPPDPLWGPIGPYGNVSPEDVLRRQFAEAGYQFINFGRGLEPVGPINRGGYQNSTGPGPSTATGQLGLAGLKVPSGGYGGNMVASNGSGGNNQPSQIIAQMSPQLTAQLTASKPASAVFAPNITVTGETLDTMEATAIRAVQAAFRDARIASGRQGGLITTGLGPSR